MTQLVIDHLWQSTLFAGLVGLLTLAFSANGANIRFGLWLSASLKFLLPFSLVVDAGKILHWNTAPSLPAQAQWPGMVGDFIAPTHAVMTPSLIAVPSESGWHVVPFVWTAWACGVAVVLLCWTLQGLRLRAALKASSSMPIEAPIEILSSPALFEPGLLGLFRPILMLPNGILDHLTPKQLDLVVAHELAHWRRRDNLTAAVHMLVEALFWFHPLVWWIGKRLVAERERACDENVLAAGGDPRAYAESIVAVCRFYMRSPIACASGVSGANLKDRVERVIRNQVARRLSRAKISALAALATATLIVPLAVGLLINNAVAQSAAPAPSAAPNAAPRTTASPGTEASLRRFIESMQKGQPNYEEMTPEIAVEVRSRPRNVPLMQSLGALKSLIFSGVGPWGADIYDATFEKGRVEFKIGPLTPDGKVAGRSWRVLPTPEEEAALQKYVTDNKPTPEREVLLRRLIAATEKGEPNIDDMSPELIEKTKQQWSEDQKIIQKVGKLQSLKFLHVNQQGWDVYEAVYEHGGIIWSVGPLTPGHKLDGVLGDG